MFGQKRFFGREPLIEVFLRMRAFREGSSSSAVGSVPDRSEHSSRSSTSRFVKRASCGGSVPTRSLPSSRRATTCPFLHSTPYFGGSQAELMLCQFVESSQLAPPVALKSAMSASSAVPSEGSSGDSGAEGGSALGQSRCAQRWLGLIAAGSGHVKRLVSAPSPACWLVRWHSSTVTRNMATESGTEPESKLPYSSISFSDAAAAAKK
mmetsp:Transcript_23273/g.50897  ORF Transcript_23273/g.50897 Transcript_23273/m.50897 type:complete len:208 (+) Transcript_23273:1732-2355(+)